MSKPQQIIQEQEALTHQPKASEYYYDQYSRNDESRFILEKRDWKTLKQNNSSGKYLTDKELEYVALINGFLKTSYYGVEYFSLEYLCDELEVTPRHLRRIRTNTSHIFKTKWRKATRSYRGRLENVYAVRPTEHTVFLLGETNYYKSEYNSFVNNSVKSVKLGHQCPISIYKDENKKNIRSNGANFLECNSKNTNTEIVKTSVRVAKEISPDFTTDTKALEQAETLHGSELVETISPIPATVTQLQSKTARPANKRKTRTREELKVQRKSTNEPKEKKCATNNLWYYKPKKLADMIPLLDDAMCHELRNRSERDFSDNFIRQRVLAMSKKPELSTTNFKCRKGFINYMTLALKFELHDSVKSQGIDFKLVANISEEEKRDKKINDFLEEIEKQSMHHVCPENQFKAKLTNVIKPHIAYNLLLMLEYTKLEENTLKIGLKCEIELTEGERSIILSQAQAVFNRTDLHGNSRFIESLEFVVKPSSWQDKKSVALPANNNKQLELPKGKWGKIVSCFIEEHGIELYKHWLEPLSVEVNKSTKDIILTTNSGMVRDRIEQTYLPFLSKVAQYSGINKITLA